MHTFSARWHLFGINSTETFGLMSEFVCGAWLVGAWACDGQRKDAGRQRGEEPAGGTPDSSDSGALPVRKPAGRSPGKRCHQTKIIASGHLSGNYDLVSSGATGLELELSCLSHQWSMDFENLGELWVNSCVLFYDRKRWRSWVWCVWSCPPSWPRPPTTDR